MQRVEGVLIDCKFSNQPVYNVVVSDLTYVRVGMCWNYIRILIDLFNGEIIGDIACKRKDATLVSKAFAVLKQT
jgi:transposase InsO family protein